MGELRKGEEGAGSFDTDNMLPDESMDINTKTDNDMLAGIIPDPRLPVSPTGGSIDQSDGRNDAVGTSSEDEFEVGKSRGEF
jgi:hypothetical protein